MFRHAMLALLFSASLIPAGLAQEQGREGPDRTQEMQSMTDHGDETAAQAERRDLMRRHMEEMCKKMQAMHEMMGKPADAETQEEIQELRKRVDLLQAMMEQMLRHHRMMMDKTPPKTGDQ